MRNESGDLMKTGKLLETAMENHRSGRLGEAEAIYREILAAYPDHPDALHLLGVVSYQRSDPETAIDLISKALSINNASPEYACNLGNAFRMKGDHLQAAEYYRQAIKLKPDYAEAYNNLGAALRSSGQPMEALDAYGKAITVNPDYVFAYSNLGNLYRELGDPEKACLHYQKAADLQPENAEALKGLGELSLECGQTEKALEYLNRASRIKPGNAGIFFSLASTFQHRREYDKAAELYQRVLDINPENVDAWNNLGTVFIDSGHIEQGISKLRRALELKNDSPEAYYNIGKGLEALGRLSEALGCYQKAVDLNPCFSIAWNNAGNIYKDQGNGEKALSCYRSGLENYPPHGGKSSFTLAEIHSNILLTMHYLEVINPDELFKLHKEWAAVHAARLRENIPAHGNDRSPGRRLRIGYVSPDFRVHSVAYFIQSVLAAHDRASFEIFCYSNAEHEDPSTGLFQKIADHWRDIYGLSDGNVSEMIQRDGIDILVDLSGHTGNNRMTLFAGKPAPVQVTYLGYPNTTGLDTVDYRITDALADPSGITDKWHSEKLIRLPDCFLCYKPPEGSPDITDLPVLKSGSITFGSFNNRAKITKITLETWSAILHKVPGSRLILKAKSLSDSQTREQLLSLFARQGIRPERVTALEFTASKKDHFGLYNTIDIALDTFPYNGTTTTCEALWMGVPVVALKGDSHVSRVSFSILLNIGLSELAGDSPDEYIAKAVSLAEDTERLKYLRHNLRAMMEKSPLMDAAGFTLNLENEFRTVWKKWCNKEKAMPDIISGEVSEETEQPVHSDHLKSLIREGEASFGSGHMDAAKNAFLKVLEQDPGNTAALHNLGVISYQAGNYDLAESYINKALAIKPDRPSYHCNLGNVFKALGKTEMATEQYEKAIRLKPDFAQAYNNLGTLFRELGRFQEAIAALQKAVETQSDYVEAFYNLGNVYKEIKNFRSAINSYEKAIRLNPGYVQAYNNLGNVYLEMENYKSAQAAFEKLIQIQPSYAQAYNNLGNAYRDSGRLEDALNAYKNAITLQPGYANVYYNMADTLKSLNKFGDAAASYLKAIELQPDNPEAYNNLGNLYKDQGRVQDALACYNKAVELKPGYFNAHSNLLLALHYDDSSDQDAIFRFHEDWAKKHAEAFTDKARTFFPGRSEGRTIRIGYVSPDFRVHSVAYFLKGILSSHDPSAFTVYCYSDVHRPDSFTKRFKTLAHKWRDIRGRSDEEVAGLIHQDKIDILIDLAGHTANNRMLVFARRPAPVQVTYLGYPDTTGLKTMDYRITDSWADPLKNQNRFIIEELIRLTGCFLCYQPPEVAPPKKELPALSTGHVTFGSFNHRAKITVHVVQAWAEILHKIPDSRLILKSGPLADKETQDFLLGEFSKNGIPQDRITLLGDTPSFFDHLELYNKIDIALDTFPYNGTTTTCEALWMGVPVITLISCSHVSRVSFSILSNMGIAEFTADSPDDYIAKAVSLAEDRERLIYLRHNLRSMMEKSPLTDAQGFTKGLENEYRKMWTRWCASDNGRMIDGKDTSEAEEPASANMPSHIHLVNEINRQGEDLFAAGRLEDSMSAFHKALEVDPDNAAAHNNVGVIYWQTGNKQMALHHFNEAIRINPEHEDAISNRDNALSVLQQGNEVVKSKTRKLHIGGKKPNHEWEIFNAVEGQYVDHIGNANNLSRFDDNTFDEIYASHVLEHFDYAKELVLVLKEWHRVMKPGGKLYVSVPDLDKLAELFLKKDTLSLKDRFAVMRMILGGHVDEYDYHKTAFNGEILSAFLNEAGFCDLKTVDNFWIFDDTSSFTFNGMPISINMIAEK